MRFTPGNSRLMSQGGIYAELFALQAAGCK
jgi:hypothetical protein